jgi:ABC-type transporter Mla MlaB component
MPNTDENLVDFGSTLTIAEATQHKNVLLQALKLAKPIVLKADKIEKIDTAGLQLLLSFIKSAAQKNIPWQWQTPSSLLKEKASLLGIIDLLKLDTVV